MTGAELIAAQIAGWKAGPVFHVPGEGILDLLDALARVAPELPLVTCRHEGGMAYMAQAVGRLTERPGICLAARAPGALNAALALHTADTDAAPMIMIIGQPSAAVSGREPFLDPDFRLAFAPMAKWVGEIDAPRRIPELMARAWHSATTGRMGPVVLVVAENVLQGDAPDSLAPLPSPAAVRPGAAAEDVARIAALLEGSRRPLVLAGGSGWGRAGAAALARFAAAHGVPVATAYRRRDLMAEAHPRFVGELGIAADRALVAAVGEADLLLVLGMRLGELNTFGGTAFEGFTLLDVPRPRQRLVHVHPALAELNRVYQADLAICAAPELVAAALADQPARADGGRAEWLGRLRAQRIAHVEGTACPGPLDLRDVFRSLRAELPDDAVLTVGAGAYALWPQRYFPHVRPGTLFGPKSGAMGYGLPAAVGIAAAAPGRRVVAVAGDGCFMMHGEELATAVLHRLPVVVLVINNQSYGAIAASQARLHGRAIGSALSAIDFAGYARALGAAGHRVRETAEFRPALRQALAADGPVLIELVTGPEALRPA